MAKKSVVLLTTLLFISAISVLIIKNLDDTEKFLNIIDSRNSLTQTQITINNIRNEIPEFFKNNKENVDDILQYTQNLPLVYGDMDLILHITEHNVSQFNINNTYDSNDTNDSHYLDDFNASITSNKDYINNINYPYDFKRIIKKTKKKYGKYKNKMQIEQTIQEYIKLTNDIAILNIKDKFTVLKPLKQDDKYIKCSYTIRINDNACTAYFIFRLSDAKIVQFNIISIF
ncbi:hypothetical protein MNB_ARC-1_870 [hydrothermal vent metagenome]|uniref:Uncharacterized protein n=1 Tax=hydrothermal vent metagenome TaxID=652676 RepID=A0A3B1E6D4_9ZZZZ